MDAAAFNDVAREMLPGTLGVEILDASPDCLRGRMEVTQAVLAPNGFLHAASVIGLADSLCGCGSMVTLPEGAIGFTTIELKSNFLGTARDGHVLGEATPTHLGRTTQVWDAIVSHGQTGKTIALFRCTQMVLWPKT